MTHPRFRRKWKSKRFSEWMHNKYKCILLHHVWRAKHNDLLEIPIDDREEHDMAHDIGEGAAQKKYNKNYEWEIINTLCDFIEQHFPEWEDGYEED